MSDKEKYIKNSLIYLLPLVATNLLPFLTLPFFTRILTPEDYGGLALAQIYAILAGGVASLGLVNGYERNFYQYETTTEQSQLFHSSILFVLFNASVILIPTFLFRETFSKLLSGSSEISSLIFWSYLSIVFMTILEFFYRHFKVTENAKTYTYFKIFNSSLNVALNVMFIVFLRVGIIGLMYGSVISGIVTFTILYSRFLSAYPLSINFPILKDNVKFSLPLTPKIVYGVVGNQFDKYLIGLISKVGEVGIYSIGQKVSYLVFSYMTALHNVYSPQVYTHMFKYGKEGGEHIGKLLTPYAYISTLIALLISFFSYEIMVILAPESYRGAVEIIMILSMYYAVLFFARQNQLMYAKKTFLSMLLGGLKDLVSIGITILFVLRWGASGAAWAIFTTGLLYLLVYIPICQHYYQIKYEFRKMMAIFLTYFAFSILIISCRNVGFGYVHVLFLKIVGLGLYCAIGIHLHVISVENYRAVKGIFLDLWESFRGNRAQNGTY